MNTNLKVLLVEKAHLQQKLKEVEEQIEKSKAAVEYTILKDLVSEIVYNIFPNNKHIEIIAQLGFISINFRSGVEVLKYYALCDAMGEEFPFMIREDEGPAARQLYIFDVKDLKAFLFDIYKEDLV